MTPSNASPCKEHPAATLQRSEIEARVVRVIHEGKGMQSSVLLLQFAAEGDRKALAVVKDYQNTRGFFKRVVAPLLISREINALRHLAGMPGVPEFYGRVDRHAFTMQYIDGTPISTYSTGELPAEVFPRIQKVIDGIHSRRVSHCDLKRRSNLLLTLDGEIYLIDFAAAVIGGRPLRPCSNWLQKQMIAVDNKSVPRLKSFVAPELLTREEKVLLDTPTFLEKLARKLFNR